MKNKSKGQTVGRTIYCDLLYFRKDKGYSVYVYVYRGNCMFSFSLIVDIHSVIFVLNDE